jgi:hypothetical protein
MKRGIFPNGIEVFTFGIENTLRIFPPNTFKFKEKGHIVLDEIYIMNKNLPKSARIQTHEIISVYVLFDGSKPGIYIEFEKIAKQKVIARKKGEDLTWKKII